MKKLLFTGFACFTALAAMAQVTVNINPDRDNSIYSESTNSNGLGMLFSGQTCAAENRRALIHFDIAGNIPAGATVTAVTLTLNVDQAGGSASSEVYTLHPLTSNWGEGTSIGTGTGGAPVFPDATWADGTLGTPWTSAGGDYSASVANTTLTAALGNYSWSSAAMVTNVQNWLNTPATNFGWILLGDESATCTARRFGSAEVGVSPVLSVTYSCATPPTATCQNLVAYLGSNGQYTLSPADLSDGSVANCGGALSFSASQTLFDCGDIALTSTSLVLTAVFDGNLAGGLPKGVEVFATNDIPDLSIYGLGSATNGGGTDGEEFSFPAVSVSAGTYIYVASESTGFTSFFGFAPDYTAGAMAINGDDGIELFENGVVIDVFGEQTWTGGPHPWFYSDGFAYRNANTGPDGGTFVIGNWTMSGQNALDPAITNATAPVPVPIGTYLSSSFIPVTLTVTDVFSNAATCTAGVIVFDTLAPDMACVGPTDFNLDISGNLTLNTGDIDAGTADGCGLMSTGLSQSTFTCADLGLNQITLTATDVYGNTNTCTADITILFTGGLVITENSTTPVTCFGDSDGEIDITISGGTPAYLIDWNNDLTGDNDDTEDLTGLAGGTYTVTVTDQGGCIAQLTVTVDEPLELAGIIDPLNISCVGENDGVLDLSVSGGTPPYLFDWDNDGTGDNDDPEDLSNLAPGVYNLLITDDNGCSVGYITDIFDATPVNVGVTQTGFSLTANASGATFQWIQCPGNTAVAGATNALFNAASDGDYAVIVTDGNGCSDTSACYTIFGLGLTAPELPVISVYPNPANQQLIISTSLSSEPFQVVIRDLQGKTCAREWISGNGQMLDISSLPNGVYYLVAIDNATQQSVRFVIAR